MFNFDDCFTKTKTLIYFSMYLVMNIHRGSENSCFEKLDKSEAVAQSCFVKKVFLKVSHVEFRSLFSNKVAGLRPGVFL